MMRVTIKDENLSGIGIQEQTFEFDAEEVTVKDIITERVKREVALKNDSNNVHHNRLIQPEKKESLLNGPKGKKYLDAEKQVYVALDAYQKNGFFILVDNVQPESLETLVKLKPDTVVTFIKLVSLVGG
ncbi:hypothetical protein FUAX_41200 (plasmid) [Fulvitalea axinellae]|uniref:Uncharacterized protein n=1 Tax=Fulvitalea axinellae TaxID=1182444 RepID=A0AAU9CUE7_9BACT|nr:hypothetical protein FUAX_41200 [Fulvitalea axinellae]